MLNALLSTSGIQVYLITKYGTKSRSRIIVNKKNDAIEPKLFWRQSPRLGCELSYLHAISKPVKVGSDHQIQLTFSDFKMNIEIADDVEGAIANDLYNFLTDALKKAHSVKLQERENNRQNANYQQYASLSNAAYEATMKNEHLLQLCSYLRYKEAYMTIEKITSEYRYRWLASAFKYWVNIVRCENNQNMTKDRNRWRLHAAANQEIDLQAWYHALFYQEVYRLRGHFWYKDAVLPVYKQSYDLVDNALTPLEEAALAHVLCSPDTSYGDVAGQMFVVQALISPYQFQLFQQLAAQGATVVKHPRQGRPAKKLFRFSFVEGNIYLTWKGKFGNQGVGMNEVTSVVGGIQTDVLKWTAQQAKAEQYLSVICSDRSVDLFFDCEEDRDNWRDLLKAIVTKEQGELIGIESVDPPDDADAFDWFVLFASIGKKSIVTGSL